MKNTEKQFVKQAEEYVTSLYESAPENNLLYHNIEHTRNVVNRSNEIAAHYELSERDITVLNIAAWFHDTGHIYTDPMMHEEKSVEIMQDWMATRLEYADMADDIAMVILSTKFSTQPANMIQQIIKDADTYHFGLPGFKKIDKLLKKEMELRNLQTMLQDWKRNTLNLLESHQYFTSYCKNLLDMGKKENINRLHKKMRDQESINVSEAMVPEDVDTGKKKNAGGGRSYITKGIQTMLRLTSENHMRLSEMADNKANILISVNAIIISVILSVLIRKIEVDTHLAIPTLIFLFSSLVTIVISILATRPKITKGSFTREDILNRRTNLLFFGNFFNTGLEEYKWGMATMMKDPNYLYGTLVDDIYYLGKVLGRKYKLVRIAYSVFMIGIIISALAFIVAIAFNRSAPATVIMEGSGSPF
ncbi:MAG TPA: DUF5706 domain-containing protein [Chitinophagaceae bacterium]|nr:DUF5706 domain-containing protein [Chitinophagaceae bacterium]